MDTTYLQPHYGTWVFGNVYLSTGKSKRHPIAVVGVVDMFGPCLTVLIFILLFKGLDNLKIGDYKYKYGSPKEDFNVTIMKKEQKLGLQLGPAFNYKKDHILFISLHSQSRFKIILHFNVSKDHCKFNHSSIMYPARLLNDSEYGYEYNLKGIKSLYYVTFSNSVSQ